MLLSNEHVGSKVPAKINTHMLTRAELLITLCYEIPCKTQRAQQGVKLTQLMSIFTSKKVLIFQRGHQGRVLNPPYSHPGNDRVLKNPSNYLSSEPPQPYRLKKTADAVVDVDPRGRQGRVSNPPYSHPGHDRVSLWLQCLDYSPSVCCFGLGALRSQS